MTLREQKKQDTWDALSEATAALATAHGFDAVTVDEIAAAARVSRRTFFRYFESKEAAFFAPHAGRIARFEQALAAPRPKELPYHTVRRCLLGLAAEYDVDRGAVQAERQVIDASRALLAWELGLDRRYEQLIVRTLVAPGADEREQLRAQVLGSAVFGVVRAVLRHWFDEPACGALVPLGETALDLLEDGFQCQRGVATTPR